MLHSLFNYFLRLLTNRTHVQDIYLPRFSHFPRLRYVLARYLLFTRPAAALWHGKRVLKGVESMVNARCCV